MYFILMIEFDSRRRSRAAAMGWSKSAVCGRPNGMIGVQVLGGSKRADRRSCLTSDRAPKVHHVSARPTSRFPLSLAEGLIKFRGRYVQHSGQCATQVYKSAARA